MEYIKPQNNLGLVARIISVPILLFSLFTIFAHILFPASEPGSYLPVENWLPFLMSISVLGLAVGWFSEMLGGTMTILFYIIHLYVYWRIREKFFPLNILVLFTPLLVDGILFIISARRGPSEQT